MLWSTGGGFSPDVTANWTFGSRDQKWWVDISELIYMSLLAIQSPYLPWCTNHFSRLSSHLRHMQILIRNTPSDNTDSVCILITSTIKVKSHKKVCMNSNYANQFIIVTTWTSRRLIPAEAWLFVLHLVQDNNKETSNRHTDNPLWPESISNKGPVTRKTFSCHHVIEICTFMPRTDYPLCNCGFQRDNTIRLTWSCKFERWIRCYMRCHYGSRALLSQHAVEGTNYGL